MDKSRIDIISMGCSKNLIDSERLLRRLADKGYEMHHDEEAPTGEYVVINTCGFIGDAKEESIETILELVRLKEEGRIGSIAVMGCLSQRYMEELKSELPEVDFWYGKFDWKAFVDALPDRGKEVIPARDWDRTLTTPEWSAYLKISEGCNRFCSFCAIPLITGRHTSRPMEDILEETRSLVARGVREFNVIAQDLSSYGLDLYGRHALAELIDRMADIPGVEWIRLHYAYPADFPMDLLDVIARRDNVCKYIDIALQHSSDKVLSNMRRHITREQTVALLEEMRSRVPDLKIRTTLMVGFPGETEEEFEDLLDFVCTQRFERMGAFAYSEEEGTWGAEHLADDIPQDVKEDRLDRLMALQQDIALERAEEMLGREVKVLVERIEGDTAIGRTQWDSPEVDPEIYVTALPASSSGEPLVSPGDFIMAKVTAADAFELQAEYISQ
ncbi:MAG: 30S ribosomal protein S12 methylthiotransferase RimO [Muribaculaceae bacterium]|nr:30S ribosomal protein S12 methylthiotransferase RimO [Muribaculaceae bacterium]